MQLQIEKLQELLEVHLKKNVTFELNLQQLELKVTSSKKAQLMLIQEKERLN